MPLASIRSLMSQIAFTAAFTDCWVISRLPLPFLSAPRATLLSSLALDRMQDRPSEIDSTPGTAGDLPQNAFLLEHPNHLPRGGIGHAKNLLGPRHRLEW